MVEHSCCGLKWKCLLRSASQVLRYLTLLFFFFCKGVYLSDSSCKCAQLCVCVVCYCTHGRVLVHGLCRVAWSRCRETVLGKKKRCTVPYCCFWSASICMLYSSACSHEYGLNTHWEKKHSVAEGCYDWLSPACKWGACPLPSVSISHVCLYAFTWPFRKSLLPQPGVPVESQMNLGCVDAVCRACNTVWMWFLRLSLFSIPLHELGKVKHRWFRQHYPLHCVQCAPIPLYPIYTLAVSTPTRLFICFLLPATPLHLLPPIFFFFLYLQCSR